MQSDHQAKQNNNLPRIPRVVIFDISKRIFRRLLRIRLNGLINCIGNRYPEVEDFDDIEIISEETVYEFYECGVLKNRIVQQRRRYTIPMILVATIISAVTYYFLS